MNYAEIKNFDIANGEGVRTTLFVSGCRRGCKNCFNEVAWNFAAGKPFTAEVADEIIGSLRPDYVDGLTLLGGEPMEPENQEAWSSSWSAFARSSRAAAARPSGALQATHGTASSWRVGDTIRSSPTACLPASTCWWMAPSSKTCTTSRCVFAVRPTSASSTCPPRSPRSLRGRPPRTLCVCGGTPRCTQRIRCRRGRRGRDGPRRWSRHRGSRWRLMCVTTACGARERGDDANVGDR